MKSQTVTIDDLAEHWSVTARRVRMLADEIPIPSKGGKFDLLEADRALIRWLQRDEPTRRSKRELLAWQRQRIEAQIARDDKVVLQPAEIEQYIAAAWTTLRGAHTSALNALYGLLCGRLGEDRARVETFVLEERVNGEMRLARERLEELSRQTIALMQSERRNGILMASRRIKALEAAIGPDA